MAIAFSANWKDGRKDTTFEGGLVARHRAKAIGRGWRESLFFSKPSSHDNGWPTTYISHYTPIFGKKIGIYPPVSYNRLFSFHYYWGIFLCLFCTFTIWYTILKGNIRYLCDKHIYTENNHHHKTICLFFLHKYIAFFFLIYPLLVSPSWIFLQVFTRYILFFLYKWWSSLTLTDTLSFQTFLFWTSNPRTLPYPLAKQQFSNVKFKKKTLFSEIIIIT